MRRRLPGMMHDSKLEICDDVVAVQTEHGSEFNGKQS